jgi:hypothetical protein
MAYLFLSDGGPEASDYSNNYFRFNESEPRIVDRLLNALSGKNPADPEVRSLVESICKSSYSENKEVNLNASLLMGWIKQILEKVSWFFVIIIKPKFTFY